MNKISLSESERIFSEDTRLNTVGLTLGHHEPFLDKAQSGLTQTGLVNLDRTVNSPRGVSKTHRPVESPGLSSRIDEDMDIRGRRHEPGQLFRERLLITDLKRMEQGGIDSSGWNG